MSSSTPQPAFDSGGMPFAHSDIRNLSMAIDIYQRLMGSEKAITYLQCSNKANIEKIAELTHCFQALPGLERDVEKNTKELKELGAQHNKDLNELGRRLGKDVNELAQRHDKDIKELEKVAHTIKALGQIVLAVIAGGFLTYLYQHLAAK